MENSRNKLLIIVGIISIIAVCSFSYYFLIYKPKKDCTGINNNLKESSIENYLTNVEKEK